MSAIWGYLSFTNTIPSGLPACMEDPYHAKCKIDRYDQKQNELLYFGCGIQYITKEAQSEVLPVFDEQNGIYFTADCILDNRNELIHLLTADSTTPDGTLMYLAYKKWGIDCLKLFRGIFSIAIYDANAQSLFLATDQTASRCLYYYKAANSVCFSTLLEPIHKVHPDLSFNELYLKDYLTAPGLVLNIIPTETPYTGVFKINPGSYIRITKNNVTEHSYWSPFLKKKYRHFTAKSYGRAFRELYTDCVNDALRTDGEVGISMSSGLDSASVGALAATLLRKKSKSLFSYTYVPYETPEHDKNKRNIHDETNDVMKIVAMHPNIKPCFLNNNGKNCLDFISQGLEIMEVPFKALVNLPNLFEVYQHAKEDNCKIVLTGQSGNATVSYGYINDVLYNEYESKHYLYFLFSLSRHCKKIKRSRKEALITCIRYYRQVKEKYSTRGIFPPTVSNPFLSEHILENYPFYERYHEGEISFGERVPMNRTEHLAYLYKKATLTYLGELDTKMGLTSGVLLRDPTRDMRILQFCADIPLRLFAYHGIPRWLIRENLSDVLPRDLLEDWSRYGVQNSDWELRIIRDWEFIRSSLGDFFSPQKTQNITGALSSFVNIQHAIEYYTAFTEPPATSGLKDFNHFCYILIFLKYLRKYS